MPSRILIIDPVATNRILIKAQLAAARYDTVCADTWVGAHRAVKDDQPDLILLADFESDRAVSRFCQDIRGDATAAETPIIVLGTFTDPERRLMALKAGADDVLAMPVGEAMLQARIRSLIRARNAAAELRLRDGTDRALGLAEAPSEFARRGRVALHGSDPARGNVLGCMTDSHCFPVTADDLLGYSDEQTAKAPDVVVLEGIGTPDADLARRLPRLVVDLRSRNATRKAGQIALIPQGADDLAALLYDVGVDDVVEGQISDSELALRVGTILRRTQKHERLRKTVRDGLRAAVTDPLTGLYNRRYAQPHLLRMAETAWEKGGQLAMMILDLDHFKSVNDTHGHASGDRVLVQTAARLRETVRSVDLVARIGGEEFMVAMPDTTVAEARAAAERIRRAISTVPFDLGDNSQSLSMTLSIGVAMSTKVRFGGDAPKIDIDELFDNADAALYRAKSSGRNAVTLAAAEAA